MSGNPTVSVVIPTYNQAAFLVETLESVLAQTFRDFEVVIIDDGSTDNTPSVLARYAEDDPRIRVIRQANAGIGAARNRGLQEARGQYVAPLDHDDLWRPGKLAAQVAFMQAHPECVACTVPWALSTTPRQPIFDLAVAKAEGGLVRHPLAVLAANQPLIISSSLLWDRKRAGDLRYETERGTVEDLALQIELLGRGGFGIAGEEVLMVYRVHSGNSSKQAYRWFTGHRMLRRFDRAGRFDDMAGARRKDLQAYLALHGRQATVNLLSAGFRAEALKLYLGDFLHQLRFGRLRFLLGFPLLFLRPRRTGN